MKGPPEEEENLLANNRVLGGRYRIEGPLGSGGMGKVFRATQIDLGRRVALKVLSKSTTEFDIARFEREARTAAGLGHPHIVQVTDFQAGNETGDPPFLVMELLEGSSFGALVRREHPLSQERVVRIGLQMLSALGAAHHAGLVHRDVKPENVVIVASPAGDLAKVVDFGLAREVEPTNGPLSKLGAVVGTPAFMAPEQARGERLDGRADLYGIAASLYYALTLRPPKDAESVVSCRRDVDARLDEIVMRGLEEDRARRYQTAEEMTTALENWLIANDMPPTVSVAAPDTVRDEPPTPPRRESPSPVRIFIASAGSVVVLGVVAALVIILKAQRTEPSSIADASVPVVASSVAITAPIVVEEDAALAAPVVVASSAASSPSSSSSPTPLKSSAVRKPGSARAKTIGKACASSAECADASEQCVDGTCICRPGWLLKVCDGECVSLPRDGDHCGSCGHACARDETCVESNCIPCSKAFPGEPVTVCGLAHVCIRLDRDPRHCGACNKSCGQGETCVLGRCRK
jgi:serine/threonine protein kinase